MEASQHLCLHMKKDSERMEDETGTGRTQAELKAHLAFGVFKCVGSRF